MRSTDTSFYNGKLWRKVSRLYLQSKCYVCERCGQPATICHHKIYLNDSNKTDPAIAYSFDNLEALCLDCHNKEHFTNDAVVFNAAGDIVRVKESDEMTEYKDAVRAVDELLQSMAQS